MAKRKQLAGRNLLEEYWKHTALNLGQAARDCRFFYYHPSADKVAKEGTARHYALSAIGRVQSLGNNLFYAAVPPHWHHTAEQLQVMAEAPTFRWFLHGYAPWKFPDPTKGKSKGAFTF